MESSAHSGSFLRSSEAYDSFMGRYSNSLAELFVSVAGVTEGMQVLDVGCGPGALTRELVRRLGAGSVAAIDPSPPFVDACIASCPGVSVQVGDAQAIPFPDAAFDAALAQLVLHFVPDPVRAGTEFYRVVRPGGVAAACVWDFAEEMEMLRYFWDAALAIDASAPDEARTLRFGSEGELAGWLGEAGFVDVSETTLTVESTYADFDELWTGFLHGIGPAGAYCVSLDGDDRERLRTELFQRMGSPPGQLDLGARARAAIGRRP
jgi:ubiquinone/menaquinone biosynthesis C-methylase UbiE